MTLLDLSNGPKIAVCNGTPSNAPRAGDNVPDDNPGDRPQMGPGTKQTLLALTFAGARLKLVPTFPDIPSVLAQGAPMRSRIAIGIASRTALIAM